MTAKEMILQYMDYYGYDGLYCECCSCTKDDIMPCGDIDALDFCDAGYFQKVSTEDIAKGIHYRIGSKYQSR